MTKLSLRMLATVGCLATASVANAQQYAGHCSQCQVYGHPHTDEFKATYHQNAMWPSAYVLPARRGICQAFELTAANGWRRNNLLGKYDFDPESETGLTEAGKLRVERILAYAPPQRRTIFVQRSLEPNVTAERVEAVQSFAANRMPGIGPIDVQETILQDDGHPAASVDAVFTGFGANQPPPVLPASNATGSGDSSAG
jgi:hypothetical protein